MTTNETIPLFVEDGFIICFTAEPEVDNMRQHFKSCGWSKTEIERVEGYAWFSAKVSAWRDGVELGAAYLGGCCYKTVEEFYTRYKDDYFAQLKAEAIAEAKARVTTISEPAP